MAQKKKALIKLSKFLAYVLGRHPDEFGLVPDGDGYVKTKELLKALSEEEGYRHVRSSHLNEILITIPDPPIEINESLIRAKDRDRLPKPIEAETPPKHLHVCIRQRAHAHVLERGVLPMGSSHVILTESEEMAERIGRRIDPEPVRLTIQTERTLERGIPIFKLGDHLYLTDAIPVGCFFAPPLPKRPPETKSKDMAEDKVRDPHPGSFEIQPASIHPKGRAKGKKKEISWKQELRRSKRRRRGG